VERRPYRLLGRWDERAVVALHEGQFSRVLSEHLPNDRVPGLALDVLPEFSGV